MCKELDKNGVFDKKTNDCLIFKFIIMEKDYVKETYKAIACFAFLGAFYLVVWIHSLLNEQVYHPFIVNASYALAGVAAGMLLGCLYGWLYLKEKNFISLAVAFLITVCLYLGYGLFLAQMPNIGLFGLFLLIILFVMMSSMFHVSIKKGRDNEQLWEKINRKWEEDLKNKLEERIKKAVTEALVKHITHKVVDSLKQSR